MSTDNFKFKPIWDESRNIQKAKREKVQEVMSEYDKTVYRPALKSLQEKCELLGHKEGIWESNGLGWEWVNCRYCHKTLKKQQYKIEGEIK